MKKATLLFMVLCLTVSVFAGETDKIGFMLELQKKLELSETQVKKLMELRTGLKKYHVSQEAKYKLAEIDLKEFSHNKGKNLKQIEKKMQELAGLKAEMEFNKFKTEYEAEKILTADQQKKFGAFMEKWHHEAMKKDKHMNVMLKEGDAHWVEEDVHVDVEEDGGTKKITIKKMMDGEGNVFITEGEDGKVFSIKKMHDGNFEKWVDKEEGDIHLDIHTDGDHKAFFFKGEEGGAFEYLIKKGEDGEINILKKNEDGKFVKIEKSEGEHKVIIKKKDGMVKKKKKVVEKKEE